MLGRQAIFHRRDGGAEFARQPSAMFVVHGRVTKDVAAAVDPQQCWTQCGMPWTVDSEADTGV